MSLLPLLALRRLLPAARHPFHLALQLLSLAAQHLLLPALLERLLIPLLLIGQLLLAAGKLFEFLERFVDLLRALALRSSGLLAGFILVLVGIEFEVEKAFQVAAGAAHAAAPTALAKGNLNLAESGFRPEEVLERFLFGHQCFLPLLTLQLIDRRAHGFGGGVHIPLETAELLVLNVQLAALHAARQGIGLVAQLTLNLGEELGRFGTLGRGGFLVTDLIPGGGDHFFLPLRDLVLFLFAAAAPAGLLRLRVFLLEGLRLDEEHVGAAGGPRIPRDGVHGDEVARHQIVVFERDHRTSGGILRALARQQIHLLLRAAVDRID